MLSRLKTTALQITIGIGIGLGRLLMMLGQFPQGREAGVVLGVVLRDVKVRL